VSCSDIGAGQGDGKLADGPPTTLDLHRSWNPPHDCLPPPNRGVEAAAVTPTALSVNQPAPVPAAVSMWWVSTPCCWQTPPDEGVWRWFRPPMDKHQVHFWANSWAAVCWWPSRRREVLNDPQFIDMVKPAFQEPSDEAAKRPGL